MALQTINSIDQLLLDIELGTGYDGYLSLVEHIRIDKDQIEHLCSWNPDHYTRKLLFRDSSVEVILMCWEPGQQSPIHNYDFQEGWVYTVHGKITVDHFYECHLDNKMDHFKSLDVPAGKYLYLNDYIGFHRVKNASEERAITIHIHAGPVLSWKVYDPETNSFYNLHPN